MIAGTQGKTEAGGDHTVQRVAIMCWSWCTHIKKLFWIFTVPTSWIFLKLQLKISDCGCTLLIHYINNCIKYSLKNWIQGWMFTQCDAYTTFPEYFKHFLYKLNSLMNVYLVQHLNCIPVQILFNPWPTEQQWSWQGLRGIWVKPQQRLDWQTEVSHKPHGD